MVSVDEAHIELEGVGKRFDGIEALAEIDLVIKRGTIHGLVGENGAGKSTLGKVIAGVVSPDGGVIRVNGRAVNYRSPHKALQDGITIITQEVALVPRRTVLENVFLGVENRSAGIIRNHQLRKRFNELSRRTGFNLPAEALVGGLRIAVQQEVEILRALARNANLIVMDEPTASLTKEEAEKLFSIIRRLAEAGTTIVYISHFLEEILRLAEAVTVLKDGRLVRTSAAKKETPERLVTAMLGRSLDLSFPDKVFPTPDSPVVCSVTSLSRTGAFDDVSFEVRAGEIVGLAGLVGSGRSEVARAIFAADRADSGRIELNGQLLRINSPREAVKRGIALLPESRKEDGLVMQRSIVENISLPHVNKFSRAGVVSRRRETNTARKLIDEIGIKTGRVELPVSTLSGGNQQKTLFAKWLLRRPQLLIADEPTRGVDVAAKRAIYGLIASLSNQGMAILLISSELEEVLGLAHRILVMRTGRVVTEFDGHMPSEDKVLRALFAPDPVQSTAAVSEPIPS